MDNDTLRHLLLLAPAFILSLSIHEWAHAWSANKLGDPTAKLAGRLTVDPLAHISWIGTVIFPLIAVLTGAPFFGWAKPVPVDARFFKKPRTDMALVAAAGPFSNIVLATGLAIIFGLIIRHISDDQLVAGSVMHSVLEMMQYAVQVNIFLALFNLIPLPPLDGSRILQGLVSHKTADKIDHLAPTMEILLLILMFTGFFRFIALPGFLFYQLLAKLFM